MEQNPQFRLITSPRIFNFSKTTKLIKLNHRDHVYNILEQKPNDQFHKIRFESSKTPKYAKSKKNPSMHEKLKINEKERVKWTYRPWREKPCKKFGRKRQKIDD